MPKSSQIFSNVCIISILALPTFFFLFVVLPIVIYNILTTLFSGFNIIYTISGIISLISLLAPPPIQKKKRIIFIQTLKAIFKRFYKLESTEEIVFKDNLINFTEYNHELVQFVEYEDKFIHFVEYTSSMNPKNDLRNINPDLQIIRSLIVSRLKKIKKTSYPLNSLNIIKNLSLRSVFNNYAEKSPQKITFRQIKILGGGNENFIIKNFYRGVEIHE
ncbi:MAG: hypothetical protein ACFFD2_24790 [Promethearchaeota archaeon]